MNLLSGLSGRLLAVVLGFVVRTVFITALGKAYLGINGYFSTVIEMLSLTELGFGTAISFKLYKPLAEEDARRIRVLMKFYKQAYRAVGLTILFLGFLLVPALPHLIRDYDRLAAIGVSAPFVFLMFLLQSVSSYLFFAYRKAVMVAAQKRYILDMVEYAVVLLRDIVQIVCLLLFESFILHIGMGIIFNLIQNTLDAWITQRYYPQYFTPEADTLSWEEIKDLFKDCAALFVYQIDTVVLKITDNIVLGAFVGLAIVGLYSNYLLLHAAILRFFAIFYTAVRASAGDLFATADVSRQYRFFETMNFLSIVLYGTGAVGFAVCADELLSAWLGRDFVIAQPLALLMGLEILFSGFKRNLGQTRNLTGAFRQMWFRPLLGILINIFVSVALVQIWGIYGVIIGTIGADILANFFIDPSVIHRYSFKNYKPVSVYYKKIFLYAVVLSAVGAFDLWFCSWFFAGYGWWSVVVHVGIVLLTVPGVYALLFWKSQECQYLLSLGPVKKIRKRVF